MATSADRDDRDEDEKDDAEESDEKSDEKAGQKAARKKGEKAGSGKERAGKASKGRPQVVDEEEDEEDEGDEGDEEHEEDEDDEEPAPKPAAKRPAARGPGAKGARGPGATRARPAAPAAQSGSLGKSVLLFFVIVIGLGAGFAILGRETPTEAVRPKWKVGDVVDVEVTLVRSDRQDLGCHSAEEVAGKHCAFEAMNKPWSKGGDANDDKQILKPYTTTDRMQFTAAGLWADPGMAPDKLPATRFSVKCKYKVEGSLKSVGVRWEQTGQWYPNNDWYAGSISDCKLAP